MRFLADENVETVTVSWLRDQGHDVVWVAESAPSIGDREVLELARNSSRILITRDLDFGEMVYREGLVATGVVLMRILAASQRERVEYIGKWWNAITENAIGNFVVVTRERVRIRPLHPGTETMAPGL